MRFQTFKSHVKTLSIQDKNYFTMRKEAFVENRRRLKVDK